MSPLLKNLIIALAVVIVLSGGYMLLRNTDTAGLDATAMNPELQARSQKILDDTSRIDSYTVDTGILSEQRFSSLADIQVDLHAVQMGTGRANPFASVR